MPDVEKVLQALEHCDLCGDMPNCPGCAYLREHDCDEHLKRDIIALLKAQEPVEPKKNDVELAGLRTWDWACPECNCILIYRANYCSCCGRAVKWE